MIYDYLVLQLKAYKFGRNIGWLRCKFKESI
jgi:hypothetical protein